MSTTVPLFALSALLTFALAQTCSEDNGLPKANTVSATGIGTRHFAGEIAVVNLAIHASAMTTQAADEEISKTSTKLKAFLLDQNIDKLETSSFSIRERSELGMGRGSGEFKGQAVYAFEVSAKKLEAIISGALAAGASEITDVSYKGTEEVKRSARMEAVKDAVSYAKAEAESATAALGMKLGKCVILQVNDHMKTDPTRVETGASKDSLFSDMAGSFPTFTGGGQSITAAVTLYFQIAH